MKTAIIFDNFGPYHIARLDASAQLCELTAVEAAASSAEYAWMRQVAHGVGEEEAKRKAENRGDAQASALSSSFRHVTLFERGNSREVHRRELVRRMNQALDDSRPEVVCVPGWSNHLALAALRWCVRRNVPAVVMSESTEWDDHRVWWTEFVKRNLVSLCATAFVGGTPHKDYIVKLGMPAERVFRGYDSVDNCYFSTKAQESRGRRAEDRTRYGLPQNYFLASARFIEKKNLLRLLQAYALYREESEVGSRKPAHAPPGSGIWDLVLLGDGPLRPDLCRLISDLRLDACVHVPGFKQYPDLPAYYGLANVFIHASTTEQWGLVVNEAMASGLPVLVSNRCGCASELVREGENGFSFNPIDERKLAQLMIKISGDSVDLEAMGQSSRKIIQGWSPERFAQGMKAACERAIADRKAERTYQARVVLGAVIRFPEKVFAAGTGAGTRFGVRGTEDLPALTVKPNFFIIGAPKSGTTSLSEYLKDHPSIYFCKLKEPHFFDLDTSKRLKPTLQTYLSLFSNADPNVHKAVGEGSTGYLFSEAAVPEILKFNPDAKFIVMLRNPVELVQSWHSEMYFEGVEDTPEFDAAWSLEGARRLGTSVPQACWEPRKLFYSEWGKLGDQVERLFSVVSRDSVKVIVFDDFVADTKRVYEEVLTFLGARPNGRTVFAPVNESRSPKHAGLQRRLAWSANYFRRFRTTSGLKLSLGLGLFSKMLQLNSKAAPRKPASPVLRAELAAFYREDVRKLSMLLGRDLSYWVVETRADTPETIAK